MRDSKGDANEAVRVSRELILKDNVDFLVGTLTSAEGPAVSPIARENKVVFIAPITKTDMLTAPQNLHPYVFRTASTTTTEGRSAAEVMAKWQDVKRVGTMSYDYAYGQDATKAFVEHLKKLRPDIEIVDQQWPKLTEQDYTPFINAQMSRKPDAVFSSLWGGGFLTFAKQARPVRLLRGAEVPLRRRGRGRLHRDGEVDGRGLPVGHLGQLLRRLPLGKAPAGAQGLHHAPEEVHEGGDPSSWPLVGYMAMQALVAGIEKAKAVDATRWRRRCWTST